MGDPSDMARKSGSNLRPLSWAVPLMVLILLLSACGATESSPEESSPEESAPETGQDAWRWVLSQDFASLDPVAVYDGTTNGILSHITDPLVQLELDADNQLHVVGMVAESWEPIDGGFRFHLRPDLQFHNGDQVTVEDVVYSIEAYQAPDSARVSEASVVTGVEVVDDQTLDLMTNVQEFDLLIVLANLLVLPAELHSADPAAYGLSPIGSGPYQVREWVPGQTLTLEANPDYWRGSPVPSVLEIRGITDPATRVAELIAGSADIIANVPVEQVSSIEGTEGLELVQISAARTIILPMNVNEPPFDDVRVRQAVNYAVDRESIVRDVLEGYGVPLSGMYAPGWQGHLADVTYDYDPERARELLADAGYPNGFDTTWHVTDGVFLKDREIAQAVANMLGAVGINVQLVPTERARLLEEVPAGDFPGISSIAWGQSPDSVGPASYVYGPETGMHLPELWSLVQEAVEAPSTEERQAFFEQVYQLSHDEALWLFTHAQDELFAKSADVDWVPVFPTAGKSQVYYGDHAASYDE